MAKETEKRLALEKARRCVEGCISRLENTPAIPGMWAARPGIGSGRTGSDGNRTCVFKGFQRQG